MTATDIPAEWIDAGVRAIGGYDYVDPAYVRDAIAAVLPLIREQIAADIEAHDKAVCERIRESCTCDAAARIAREGRA